MRVEKVVTVPVAVSTFDIKRAICIFTDDCWRPSYTFNVPHYYLFPPGDVRCVVVTTSLSSKERFEVLPSTYFDKGVSPLRDGGGSALGSRLSLLYPKQKSSAHLPNLSKDQAGRVTWQVLTRGTPLDHSCGRVAKLALERWRVQQRCPRDELHTDPRTGQRAPTQEPALLKGETCFCPGVLSSPCPGLPVAGLSWFRVAGSPALPLRVPVCFVPPDVSFPWPRASRSSSQREGRRVKRRGTDPRTGTGHRPKDRLFQVPLYVRVSRLFRRACLVLSLPLCYFIFAYVPLVRDAFRLPSTAHYWPQVILRLDCGSFICTRPPLS